MRERGFSLVELMVASVIGMVTILAITQSMMFFDGQRRGTTSGVDAQSNGAFATYIVERDLRMAGYAVFGNDTNLINFCLGGSVVAYNSQRAPVDLLMAVNAVPFAPVAINPPGIPAGDANTDVIGVLFGNSAIGVSGDGVQIGTDNGTGITVNNSGGFSAGDLVLAVPTVAGTACSIYEITDGPGAVNCSGAGTVTQLMYGQAQYASRHQACTAVAPTRNKAGGLGVNTVAYSAGRLFNLGRRDGLAQIYYAIRSGRLTRCDHQASDCSSAANLANNQVWVPVSEGVVSMRAEFGIASGGQNAAVDTWRTGVCNAANCVPSVTDWQNLRVIRIALVARSQQLAGAGTTTVAPQWGGQTAISLDGTVANWESYRYNTTEVVIPLKNIVWGMSS
ncbi:MAG: PilW family protein [Dechloromonas sp.]|nr:PilW family protein [Dechloromonas sp.]